jgi:transcriptional regulator with XRE-family HTH domain
VPSGSVHRVEEGRLLRAARALLGWTIDDLARAATLGTATVKRAEHGGATTQANAKRLRSALESAGIVFQEATPEAGVGVRLRGPPA